MRTVTPSAPAFTGSNPVALTTPRNWLLVPIYLSSTDGGEMDPNAAWVDRLVVPYVLGEPEGDLAYREGTDGIATHRQAVEFINGTYGRWIAPFFLLTRADINAVRVRSMVGMVNAFMQLLTAKDPDGLARLTAKAFESPSADEAERLVREMISASVYGLDEVTESLSEEAADPDTYPTVATYLNVYAVGAAVSLLDEPLIPPSEILRVAMRLARQLMTAWSSLSGVPLPILVASHTTVLPH
jgi:hypothetical protein